MLVGVAAIFRAAIRQYAQHGQAMLFVIGQTFIIQHVRLCNRGLGRVQLDLSDLGTGIGISLLIDPSDSLSGLTWTVF